MDKSKTCHAFWSLKFLFPFKTHNKVKPGYDTEYRMQPFKNQLPWELFLLRLNASGCSPLP